MLDYSAFVRSNHVPDKASLLLYATLKIGFSPGRLCCFHRCIYSHILSSIVCLHDGDLFTTSRPSLSDTKCRQVREQSGAVVSPTFPSHEICPREEEVAHTSHMHFA